MNVVSESINDVVKSKHFMIILYSSALASQVVLLSDVLTKTVIIPLLDKHFFNNNFKQENYTSLYADVNTPQNMNASLIINKNGIEFDIGKIFYVLIRFIIIIIFLIIFYRIFMLF